MADSRYLVINQGLAISKSELEYRATPAGGPGGQHVNRSSTKVELHWDLPNSAAVSDETRALLLKKLANRLDTVGRVRVVAGERRSQLQNRLAAESKLADLVRRALHRPKPRRATRPTKASVERRLNEKHRRSDRKRERGRFDD